MKNPKLGDFLIWRGKLAQVIAETDARTVIIEMHEEERCPHCSKSLGRKQFSIVVNSPSFQDNAEPVQTMIVI